MPDLGESVRAFEERYGLRAVPGGRHPGAGTANAIVEIGNRQYLELIAVVDAEEASASGRGRRVLEAIARGDTFATWAVRVGNLEQMKAVLREDGPIMPGARERPDGTRLEWRTLEPAAAASARGVPFMISWGGEVHPGARGDGHVARLLLEDIPGGPVNALLQRVGLDVDYELRDGPSAKLLAVELEIGGRRLSIM
jgi:hypothetical protein